MDRPPRPFRAERYDLAGHGAGYHLSAIRGEEAVALADRFAAMEPWRTYATPPGSLASLFCPADDGGIRLALRNAEGTPRGVAVVREPWLVGPYMQFLAVDTALQGLGLGTAILDWMEAQARDGGARNQWICHYVGNQRAGQLYRRHGFRAEAELHNLIRDGFHEVLMRKALT